MEPKLALLFALIGVIIALSHLDDDRISRVKRQLALWRRRKPSGVQLKSLKVDGGMVANDLLMQFQADILNVPVVRPIITETTALGAAYAAGLAVGFWKDFDELRKNWKQDRNWQPAMQAKQRDLLYAGWKKAVLRTLNWVE